MVYDNRYGQFETSFIIVGKRPDFLSKTLELMFGGRIYIYPITSRTIV